MKRQLFPSFLFAALLASPLAAVELGSIDFPVSAGPRAKEHFLTGVLWLHSFEYDDARDAFLRAQAAEPGFAMAYWGEAMTYNHPIWLEEDLAAGRAALAKLGATSAERLAAAATPRERGYVAAVEILFGDGEKVARDQAYLEAMAGLAASFPEDLEAASFHALAILGAQHEKRDFAAYMRAAAVAEEVFAANPRHPGAAHYLIHSYDDAVHAPLGLRAARAYASIAPAAEHALHMPSHVFLALGLWDQTVASNEDSWRAAEARVARRHQGVDRRGYHALLWLQYAYLQQGRLREARALLDLIAADAQVSDSPRVRSHFALMRAHQTIESPASGVELPRPDLTGLLPEAAGASLFADGWAALGRGDLEGARGALAAIRGLGAPASGDDPTRCHAPAPTTGFARTVAASKVEVQIMETQLAALLARAEGKTDEAVSLLQAAVGMEEKTRYGYGPPIPVKPSRELLGEVLLELGRPAEAQAELAAGLERTPRRALALRGLERAAREAGDLATAKTAATLLAEVHHRADGRTAVGVATAEIAP